MKVTCLAKSRDVGIEGESGVHDDTKTCDLIRKFDVILPAILMDGIAGKVRKRWRVPNSMYSDLSGLRHRPL